MTVGVDDLLATARQRLQRLDPQQALSARQSGAALVDIRPDVNRVTEGTIPGALVVDRNVLEWRLDPTSPARLPWIAPDVTVVLFCNKGYASSLAAATLQDLGLAGATDMIGGFRAWRAQGLPTDPPG